MRRKYINRYDYDENSSQYVFELRREKKLLEAYNLALKLYDEDPNDEWIERAYLWTLVDIVKQKISPSSPPPISLPTGDKQIYFDKLLSINTDDEILLKQIQFLKPKLSIDYGEIQEAETLSKNGKHSESLELFRKIKNEGKLSSLHHESFGWAIFRYLNANKDTLEIGEVKKLLFEYIKLSNKRPEVLHSAILKFAISYSSKHHKFDLFKFFQLWDVNNLRDEDYKDEYTESKTYPSMVPRLIKGLANEDDQLDIDNLQNVIGDRMNVIDIIRETIFWKLFNLHKEENLKDLWVEFDNYASKYSKYGSSKWHSEILKIADRFMVEENSNRFFVFLQNWNIENFQDDDWEEEINGDFVNKPLVLRSIKKIFDFAKIPDNQTNKYDWVLPLYIRSLEKYGIRYMGFKTVCYFAQYHW